MAGTLIYANSKVNSKKIRKVEENGVSYWVVPSYTLPANVVMNKGLYPAAEIDAHYEKLEGTQAPLGHPQVNGQFISALSPEGLGQGYIGAHNRNVKKSGNRVSVEKWINVNRAKESEGGRRVLERLEAIERGDDVPPIHTSVALFLDKLPVTANSRKEAGDYEWIARIREIDHDAILLDEPGAATPADGVGMMVNCDQAENVTVNASGVFTGDSFREKERLLNEAAKSRFVVGDDGYVWVADFDDSNVVLVHRGGESRFYSYKRDGGVYIIEGDGEKVERKESWVASFAANVRNLFTLNSSKSGAKEEGDMPLTKEEQEKLVKDVSAGVAGSVAEAVANAMKPVEQRLTDMEANQKKIVEDITANAQAKDDEKRAIIAPVIGVDAANALSGAALDSAIEATKKAGNLGKGLLGNSSDNSFDEVPD